MFDGSFWLTPFTLYVTLVAQICTASVSRSSIHLNRELLQHVTVSPEARQGRGLSGEKWKRKGKVFTFPEGARPRLSRQVPVQEAETRVGLARVVPV